MNSSPNSQTLALLGQDRSTVFRVADIAMITGETDRAAIVKRMWYAVRKGWLCSPCKGIYAKNNYSFLELACKLYVPSYVSLETVLQQAGVIFQYSEKVTMVAYLSREVSVDGRIIAYRKLKNELLMDFRGIKRGEINAATPERAFLDMLYLNSHYYFDNPSALDAEKVKELFPVYNSPTLEKRALKILNHGRY